MAERPAVPHRPLSTEGRVAAVPSLARLGRDQAVPASVHARSPPPPLYALRDPRTDPGSRGRRYHLVGPVESAQRLPAWGPAPEGRRGVSGGAHRLERERRPL